MGVGVRFHSLYTIHVGVSYRTGYAPFFVRNLDEGTVSGGFVL